MSTFLSDGKNILKQDVVPFLLPILIILSLGAGVVTFLNWQSTAVVTPTPTPTPQILIVAPTPTASPSATPTATPSASPKVVKPAVLSANTTPRSEIDKIVCSVFVNNCTEALKIMACESGGNPNKVNSNDSKKTGYSSHGLFQINGPNNWNWSDPLQNTLSAKQKYDRRGWRGPWTNCSIQNGLV